MAFLFELDANATVAREESENRNLAPAPAVHAAPVYWAAAKHKRQAEYSMLGRPDGRILVVLCLVPIDRISLHNMDSYMVYAFHLRSLRCFGCVLYTSRFTENFNRETFYKLTEESL